MTKWSLLLFLPLVVLLQLSSEQLSSGSEIISSLPGPSPKDEWWSSNAARESGRVPNFDHNSSFFLFKDHIVVDGNEAAQRARYNLRSDGSLCGHESFPDHPIPWWAPCKRIDAVSSASFVYDCMFQWQLSIPCLQNKIENSLGWQLKAFKTWIQFTLEIRSTISNPLRARQNDSFLLTLPQYFVLLTLISSPSIF